MRIGRDHQKLSSLSKDFNLETLADGEIPQIVSDVLRESGRSKVRWSPLHPRFMLWLVVGLMLWRHDSIAAVLGRLISGMRGRFGDLSLKAVTDGALAHARKRLGIEPLRRLFQCLASRVHPEASFAGLKVWIIDGTLLTMQDTQESLCAFGRRHTPRGRAAFCEIKMVCLVDATRHLIRDVVLGLWNFSEIPGAQRLIRHLGADDLVILDRLFCGLPLLSAIRDRGTHFLCRASAHMRLKPIRGTRRGHQYEAWLLRRSMQPLRVRVIDFHLQGYGRIRLTTSLLDRQVYSAADLAVLYHRRWEAEIAFDEIKTHQNANAHGQIQTTFRSKTPRNVMQEAYAMLVAYHLVRHTMASAAKEAHMDPRRLSFLDTLRAIHWMTPRMQAAPTEALPALYKQLLRDLIGTNMDRWRRHRAYPRVVRVKTVRFHVKHPEHGQILQNMEERVRRAVA